MVKLLRLEISKQPSRLLLFEPIAIHYQSKKAGKEEKNLPEASCKQ
jgi:hypothetical protein